MRRVIDSDSDEDLDRGNIPLNFNPRSFRQHNNLSSDEDGAADVSDDENNRLLSNSPAGNTPLGVSPMDEEL